jgi:cupin superfamily acireductone dioxygenase involved in methionine salvage
MRMHNIEVESLGKFLLGINLKGRESRMRTRFIKLLQERIELISAEHQELIKQHSVKDENGEPKTIENEQGQKVYDIVDMQTFNKDYNELMIEEFVIEVTESNRSMIEVVSNAVFDCDEMFSGQDALVFDRYCEIMEGE